MVSNSPGTFKIARHLSWLLMVAMTVACSDGGDDEANDCRSDAETCSEGFECTQQSSGDWSCTPISADAGTDASADDQTEEEATPPSEPLYYVIVADLETAATSSNGRAGADIDGVSLTRGNTIYYAAEVMGVRGAGDTTQAGGLEAARGRPEGCTDPLEAASLGTSPGWVGVSFGNIEIMEILEGDTITVYECEDPAESYSIYLSPTGDLNDPDRWICAASLSGEGSCEAPAR